MKVKKKIKKVTCDVCNGTASYRFNGRDLCLDCYELAIEPPAKIVVKKVKFSPRDFRLGRMRDLFTIKTELKRIHDVAMSDMSRLMVSIENEIESLHKTNLELSPIEPEGRPNMGNGV